MISGLQLRSIDNCNCYKLEHQLASTPTSMYHLVSVSAPIIEDSNYSICLKYLKYIIFLFFAIVPKVFT